MKKHFYLGILLVIFLFILVFSEGVNLNNRCIKNDIQGNDKIIWDGLNCVQKNISNTNYSHDKKMQLTLQYIDELLVVLENEKSFELSDETLEKKLNYSINSISKEISNTKIRIISYNAVPGVFGTSEGNWTIIQWRDQEKIHSQILFFNTADVVLDFIVQKNETLEVLLGGYVTLYNPSPIFLSSWTLKNEKWEKNKCFNDVKFNENFTVDEDFLMIENQKNKHLEINKKNNGFIISNIDDNIVLFEIFLDNGKISLIKY